MSRIRDLRKFIKFINRLQSGSIPPDVHALEVLEETTKKLQGDLLWAFSTGSKRIPPKKRVERANVLCKAGHIILAVRDQKAISQNLNGALDALEEAVERTEERREIFLNAHPKLKRKIRGRPAP